MQLLERDACLHALNAAFADAATGAGRVALVSGEAGIGKTALIERFVNARRADARVLWGACDALFTPRPLGPLHDMAAQVGGDLPALLAADGARSQIFAAVRDALQRHVMIAVFEDVHWADEATLDLLRFLARRVERTRALLVLTYRDDELDARHPLRLVLGDLAASSTVRLPLAALSERAVRALVGTRAIDATTLHRQTGGNPFFVTEVLANTGAGVPPTVRDAVLARAARLSLAGRAVLQAAAVIGPRIEPWLLAEVMGAEAQAADEPLATGMLLAQGDLLTFRHDLARQAVLDIIPPYQRLMLHRRVLAALRAAPITRTDVVRLAHHAAAAYDNQAVQEYAPAAAEHAAAAGAHREAVALYALVVQFADDLPPERYALLLEAYAQQCDHVGQQKEGLAARQRALDIWRKLDNPLKQGENLAHMMSMQIRLGQNAEAQRLSRAAVEILEALPPGRELALAYRVRAQACLVNRDVRETLEWAEKARRLAECFDDAEVLAWIYTTIGTAWLFLDYERGCAYLEDKLAFARAANLDARVAHMYANLGSGSGELFYLRRAERYLLAGIAYTVDRHLDSFRLYMQAWLALVYCHVGRWNEARDVATAVLHSPGVTVISRITALAALGRLAVRCGDADAFAALDQALDLAIQTDTIQRLGLVRAARAEAAWHAGDHARAVAEACAVYELAASKQHPWFTGELAFWRWRAGDVLTPPAWIAPPYALHLAGDWRAASDAWAQLGCPYEQARALADGDAPARLAALNIFDRLGARPAAEALRQILRSTGVARVPRGPRPTTRLHPFGLTARQVEILALLAEKRTNAEIAARLHISAKTVDHHVSAVLGKLNVHSRAEAVELARQHHLLPDRRKQHGST